MKYNPTNKLDIKTKDATSGVKQGKKAASKDIYSKNSA